MRARLASLSFLLASISTGLAWLSIQPTLFRLTTALAKRGGADQVLLLRVQAFLPYQLALHVLVVGALTYGILQWLVGRPLQSTETLIEQLEHLNLDLPSSADGGPLLARLHASLQRTAHSLRDAQRLTGQQLEALSRSNTRLRQAQAELVASEQLATVGRLAAGVAHEVGNPLSGILGYLSLARSLRPNSGPELEDFLQRIETEVQRINGIVRSLLELGRPARANLGPVALAPLVESCVTLLRAGPDFSGVQVLTQLDGELAVMAEPGPLSQVLINLLLNAAQAMGNRGRIHVEARKGEQGLVELRVRDEGPGISPEVAVRLFEPFFTTKAPGKGTGLGLAVSRQLALNLGAQLSAQNAQEGGAMFVLTFPALPLH
jgi:signal transduction histidine kinase